MLWMKVRWVVVGVVSIIFVFLVLLFIRFGYQVEWTGFGEYSNVDEKIERSKTLWDWMELILIPLILFLIAAYFNESAKQRERIRTTDERREDILDKYYEKMSKLMIEQGLLDYQYYESQSTKGILQLVKSPAPQRNLARTLTLNTFSRLDDTRRAIVIQFLHDSGLIQRTAEFQQSPSTWIHLEKGSVEVDLTGIDLRGIDFQEMQLFSSVFSGAILDEANLSGANLNNALLYNASLKYACMHKTAIRYAQLDQADLQHADMREIYLWNASLYMVNLKNADLRKAYLKGSDLRQANLQEANLTDAIMDETTILPDETKWSPKVDMNCFSNPRHANFWSGAVLLQALKNETVFNFDFTNKNLRGAWLKSQKLKSINLHGATLAGCHLEYTNLENAKLSQCDLQASDLRGANLSGATLEDSKFDSDTILPDETKWLPTTDLRRFTDPQHNSFWQPKY